jgi:hypothetical protein
VEPNTGKRDAQTVKLSIPRTVVSIIAGYSIDKMVERVNVTGAPRAWVYVG